MSKIEASISWCEILRIQDTNLLRFRLIFEYKDNLWSDDVQISVGDGTLEEELEKIKGIIEEMVIDLYKNYPISFNFNWTLPENE